MNPERWHQIEEIYHRAEALPEGERAAFLNDACRDDESMRREIEILLKESVDSGFLAAPAAVRGAHLFADISAGARVGDTIGTYQIEGLLGIGGMGEVYRARDSRLGRSVAIKILPSAFSTDPDRVARLDREARVLATLNHPNICAIYEIERIEGIQLLVLELVEGRTLAEQIESRAAGRHAGLPLAEALTIARQITEALEAAHEKSIVHRDLKPANIRITADGTVKILDFGLAKSVTGGLTPDLTLGPQTLSGPRHGIVMGTAAYMSPEQARGLPVDRRTDIWSFGCVLYEMLTGRVAFAGDTTSDSIAKVLEREPDWSALPAATPVPIRRLLFRSLAKDLKKRLKDISDVRLEIEAIDEQVPGVAMAASQSGTSPIRAWLPWAVAALTTIGLLAVAWPSRPPAAPQVAPQVARLSYILPADQRLNGSRGAHIVALSPDGLTLAYSAQPFGLYLKALSETDAKVVPGTEEYEVAEPVFSPDGRSIAFYSHADQTIKKIAVTGGAAQTLCSAGPPFGMRWDADGLVFGQGNGGVKKVSADATGGDPQPLITVTGDELAHEPQILPDGDHVLFTLARGTAQNRWDTAQIVVQSLKTSARKVIFSGGSDARYLPSGHLVFAFSGSLYAQTFDLRTLELTGQRVPVVPEAGRRALRLDADGIRRAAGTFTGAAVFSVSTTGTLAYVPGPSNGGPSAPMDLGLMNRKGEIEPVPLNPPGLYALPRVSPDGSHVAFESDDGREVVIYTYDLSGATKMQRLNFGGHNRDPLWVSDNRLAFQSDNNGSRAIWWQAPDGQFQQLTFPEPGTEHAPESWHDGTLLYSVTKGTDVSLWTYSPKDHKPAERFDAWPSSATTGATFRPDGQWVAYASTTEQTHVTLYIQRFPSGPPYELTTIKSDTPKHPRWSSDGKELCYDPGVARLECVKINTESFAIGKPEFVPRKIRSNPPGTRTNYDIAKDGRIVGFITAGRNEYVGGPNNEIQVVLNWFTELKAATGR